MKIHNPTSIGTLAAFTGSFSGSFKGEGSNLTGVPAPSGTISGSAQIDYSGSYHVLEVKVVSDGGNKFQIDGVTAPNIRLIQLGLEL